MYDSVKTFADELRKALNKLISDGFIITGIVSDNLRTQINTIQETIKDFPGIVHVPCGCHTLQLALEDVDIEFDINSAKEVMELGL